MRYFNTEGPVEEGEHYLVPPLTRVDLDEILTLVRRKKYFVLHAPRQTGKTTILLALRDLLNSGSHGEVRCVYASLEIGRTAGKDVGRAVRDILRQLAAEAQRLGDGSLEQIWRDELQAGSPGTALRWALSRWSEADARPLVLLLDEVDTLTGDPLLSLLSQLRSGYTDRSRRFPQSVVLCGLRDVRDYRAPGAPGSPFNIKARSLRLGDFSEAETRSLLGQHTEDTGQRFAEEALGAVWRDTQGQPWLVNALAAEACFGEGSGDERSRTITEADIVEARERLIRRRQTHLDNLTGKLEEDRVRRVIEPILSGGEEISYSSRDLEYVRDLGLVALDPPLRIANRIYAEVIPRELTEAAESGLSQQTAWYVTADGDLDFSRLLLAFQEFFRRHAEHWLERFEYREAAPQLLLQAFLQRVVNAGGRIEREYALGRGRTDLLVVWGRGEGSQEFVVECKIVRDSAERTRREGLTQTAGYLERSGVAEGHLVLFDRRDLPWEEKLFREDEEVAGRKITVWGM